MKENKYLYGIIELFILLAVILLAFTSLNSEYLFGWAAHNWVFYLVLSLIPLTLLLLNKHIVSFLMTIGISVGIFAANYLGKILRIHNMNKIVEGMQAEEVARLYRNYGFSIWIAIIVVFLILGIIMQTKIDH